MFFHKFNVMKIAEMLLGVVIFAMHLDSWNHTHWAVHLLITTGFCSPIIPLLFRVEGSFYNLGTIGKAMDIILLGYCIVAYAGASILTLWLSMSEGKKTQMVYVAIAKSILAIVLAIIIAIDLVFTAVRKKPIK